GGSIRIPAAFGGAYGIKPTRARVPAWPAAPLGTLGHVGCPTRCVAEAAPVPSLGGASSPRLGYAKRVEPEIAAAVAAAAGVFAELGAQVEEADPDLGGDPIAAWTTLWWSSAAALLQPFDERVRELADPGLVAGGAPRAGAPPPRAILP